MNLRSLTWTPQKQSKQRHLPVSLMETLLQDVTVQPVLLQQLLLQRLVVRISQEENYLESVTVEFKMRRLYRRLGGRISCLLNKALKALRKSPNLNWQTSPTFDTRFPTDPHVCRIVLRWAKWFAELCTSMTVSSGRKWRLAIILFLFVKVIQRFIQTRGLLSYRAKHVFDKSKT